MATFSRSHLFISAACTTDTGLNLSASYTYSNDLLTSIQTPSTTYGFTYGDFDLRTSVSAGSYTLAEYTYTNDKNRYLSALDYGNGDSVQYTYDDHGRLVTQTYEDGDSLHHKYDNSGNLASVWDSATARTTYYYYDLTDRMMKYVEKGDDGYSHSVGYEYNKLNNLTQQVETINGVDHTTSYSYDDDNRVTSVNADGTTVEYTYDTLGRVSQKLTKRNGTTYKTENFTYTSPSSGKTSSQVATYNIVFDVYNVTYSYTYDDNGNILSISDGSKTTSYVYDSANQLIRENNQAEGYTHTWEYDAAGNILNRKEYAYTTGSLEGLATTGWDSYVYGDENWGDLLTEYNGNDMDHDELGNLIYDGEWDYTWKHGRQLASMYRGSNAWTFQYNADGMRTQRTNGTTTYTYVYNGSQLTRMTVGDEVFDFTYDADGTPLTVTWNGNLYYYVTNLQGDVIRILDADGRDVATYTYDAWGVITQCGGCDQIELYNPLCYRGYVYDIETGLYYVSSRYYDPEIGRFINADAAIGQIGNVQGTNMFAYCFNNPVNMSDPSGGWPKWLETAVKVASVVVAVTAVVVMVATVSAVSAGTAAPGALLGASVFLGAALSGINGGVANEAKGNSYINGYLGGATGGTIQATCSKTPAGTIVGGGAGVTVGTAVTDIMNNLDPDSANSTAKEIALNAITSGGKALVTSSLTAYMGYASDLAAINGANGLMPTYTRGFGEAVKAFFGWLDDALVYIWE